MPIRDIEKDRIRRKVGGNPDLGRGSDRVRRGGGIDLQKYRPIE